MTTTSKQQIKAIPQRADIDDKYKWNLADIYQTEDDWRADYEKAKSLIEKAGEFSGKLGDSTELLYECFETRTELLLICDNLYQYAKLSQDIDNRVSKCQAMTNQAAMLSSQAMAAFSFLEPELLTIDNAHLTAMAEQFPKTDVYDFYLKELIRSRAHIRSAEVEEVLAQSAMVARGPDSVFTMLDDADIKYPSIEDEEGIEVQLTKQRYAKFMESPLQRVRREAHEGFLSAYKDHVNTLGTNLSTSINKDAFFARVRRYESSLYQALDGGNIPVSVYHSLLDTTEADLTALHKWTALRKKILKLDKIYPYDMFCPLFPKQNYEVPYDEAVQEVLDAVAPLGDVYVS
ncbi:MAG: oligoendopeptidase F, partial [candidate division Zixibacteria bacterium]|nr:oligoendopeptidase F [candidate division Zixibacteria bacterium]